MLYYRTSKKQSSKGTNAKKGAVFWGIAIWLFWIVSEIPVQLFLAALVPASNTVIAQGKISLYESVEPPNSGVGDGIFTEPAVGVLTSPYGERWGRAHEGIDIGGEAGSDILAADSGTVSCSQWVDGYGNYIEIDHSNGFKTAYGHCSELYVKQGEIVTQGQVIAAMGSTGNSTGTHLHFEVLLDGEPQNPLDYVMY